MQETEAVAFFQKAGEAEVAGEWREALTQYKNAYWASGKGALIAEIDVLRDTVGCLERHLQDMTLPWKLDTVEEMKAAQQTIAMEFARLQQRN